MKVKRALLALLLAGGCFGCGKQQPRHIVILVDVSGSIDRHALKQAFKAIDATAGRLKRGDRIAIIPILGDAEAQTSGRIVRFEVPTARRAYDADLRELGSKLSSSLDQMCTAASDHPGSKTDILGTVALASQEFQANSGRPERVLVILSDFIQEDRELDFRKDDHLRDWAAAAKFSEQAAKKDAVDFRNTPVYLGLLRSNEYSMLGKDRRAAIEAFWITYFNSLSGKPRFAIDGPGLLEGFEPK